MLWMPERSPAAPHRNCCCSSSGPPFAGRTIWNSNQTGQKMKDKNRGYTNRGGGIHAVFVGFLLNCSKKQLMPV